MNDIQGRFLWYELMTTDTGEGARFYTSLLGWTTQEWDNEMGPYTMFVNGETPMAGMMVLPEEAKAEGAPPSWLGYTGVPDVDATVSRAQSLGGRVVAGPMDIPAVGRIAVLVDPQGAVFAIFTPLEPASKEGTPGAGSFGWHELGTTDLDDAVAFYSDIFGWKILVEHDMGGGSLYRIFGRGGPPPMGGMYAKTPQMPGPPAWLYYVLVDDVAALLPRVSELGGRVLNGPMDVPDGGVVAQCMDPQGAVFALYSNATRDR
ncbi:MAG: VOC family protein [Acidobacteria bacterium]|nr:VOC family protein [Acidobacteriota bacterium]